MAIWIGEVAKPGGFADAGRNYLAALASNGYRDLLLHPYRAIDWRDRDFASGGPFGPIQAFRGVDFTKINQDVVVVHHFPTEGYKVAVPGKKNVALTMWETDRLPQDAKYVLDFTFDEIWVPCEQNRVAFTESGVTKPIRVIPHALGPAVLPRRAVPSWRLNRYVFYFIGADNARKNPEGVVRAYLREFKEDEGVALMVKVWTDERWDQKAEHVVRERLDDRVRAIAREEGKSRFPPIVCVEGVADETLILQIHAWGDCYVSAHRGEGWGLAIHRAKQLGRKVIATGWGGPVDFLDPTVDDLIPFTMADVGDAMAFRPGFGAGLKWADPDIEALRAAMRKAADGKAKGSAAGTERFSWEAVGPRLAERIEALRSEVNHGDA